MKRVRVAQLQRAMRGEYSKTKTEEALKMSEEVVVELFEVVHKELSVEAVVANSFLFEALRNVDVKLMKEIREESGMIMEVRTCSRKHSSVCA